MRTPRDKLLAGLLVAAAALMAGRLQLLTPADVKMLLFGTAAFLGGYSLNGFGQLKGVPAQVEESVKAAISAALGPFMSRLEACEEALGLQVEKGAA